MAITMRKSLAFLTETFYWSGEDKSQACVYSVRMDGKKLRTLGFLKSVSTALRRSLAVPNHALEQTCASLTAHHH